MGFKFSALDVYCLLCSSKYTHYCSKSYTGVHTQTYARQW